MFENNYIVIYRLGDEISIITKKKANIFGIISDINEIYIDRKRR
jgi:hypothetical protein